MGEDKVCFQEGILMQGRVRKSEGQRMLKELLQR